VIVDRSTELDAPAEKVWAAVKTPRAFRFVTKGLLTMPAIDDRANDWVEGETVTGWVFLFGLVPFSRHRLRFAEIDDASRTLRSNEGGGLLRKWDHDIEVTPLGENRCLYRDRIELEAGLVTPLIWIWARWFYRTRQQRWRNLSVTL
jgi:ligand-binding SRPBCC domain-containing protein